MAGQPYTMWSWLSTTAAGTAIVGGLIALLGAVLGALWTEVLRRWSRIEPYALRIFDKRLEVHAELLRMVDSLSTVGADLLENTDYTKEERHDIVSAAVLEVAEFCDRNQLYLEDALAVHCVALLMGVEDVEDARSAAARDTRERLMRDVRSAKMMIRDSSGVSALQRHFRSLTRPKLTSPVIEYYRAQKRRLRRQGREG